MKDIIFKVTSELTSGYLSKRSALNSHNLARHSGVFSKSILSVASSERPYHQRFFEDLPKDENNFIHGISQQVSL